MRFGKEINNPEGHVILSETTNRSQFSTIVQSTLKDGREMTAYGLLAVAIAFEVVATLSLRASNGFTRFGPSLLVVGGYAFAFLLLSLVLQRGLDVAVVYALWSATGIVVITLVGALWLGETLAPVQVIGMLLIVVGVLALELGARAHA